MFSCRPHAASLANTECACALLWLQRSSEMAATTTGWHIPAARSSVDVGVAATVAARAEAEELKMLLAAQEAEARSSVLEADIRMAQVWIWECQGACHAASRFCKPQLEAVCATLMPPLATPQLEGQRQDVQAALTGAEAAIVELERRLRTQSAALDEGRRALRTLEQRAAAAEASSEAMSRRTAALEAQLQQAQADTAAAQARLREEEQARRAGQARAAAEASEGRRGVSEAQSKLAAAQQEHAAREAELQGRLQELKEKLEEEQERLDWEAEAAKLREQSCRREQAVTAARNEVRLSLASCMHTSHLGLCLMTSPVEGSVEHKPCCHAGAAGGAAGGAARAPAHARCGSSGATAPAG